MKSNIPAREAPALGPLVLSQPVTTTVTVEDPALDVNEIQGNILAGFSKDHQMLLFLRIKDATKFRSWLKQLIPSIATTAEVLQFNRLFKALRAKRKVESRTVLATWINIAFSFSGLEKLMPDAHEFKDEAFKQGLAKRSPSLNDPKSGEGSPDTWVIGGTHNEADGVIIVASDSANELAEEVMQLENCIFDGINVGGERLASGVELIFKQRGDTLPDPLRGHEHFGFLDGVSQPGVRGTVVPGDKNSFLTPRQNPDDDGQGKPGQDLLWPGEFVFGYPKQSGKPGADISESKPEDESTRPEWAKNGSFLTFRRLRQDVGGFHKFLEETATQLGIDPRLFGAKCVGRWDSGAPILRTPLGDNPAMSRDDCANNRFEFGKASPIVKPPGPDQCVDKFPASPGDKTGDICPFSGHIRKAYPRDDTSGVGKPDPNESDTQTHRLLRRGIPFGDPFDRTIVPDNGERGLLFLAYQTSIVNQFEFVTHAWVNNPDFKDPGSGHDPILGQSNSANRQRVFKVRLDGKEHNIKLPKDWVIPTGGGYFFAPSISALTKMAK
jgi:Dyp-type peroxidase family